METIGNEEEATGKEFGGMPFIRVPRSLINGPIGQEKRIYSKFEACVDLIQMARYSDNEKREYISGKLITWNRGQIAASIRFLTKKWKWSKDKVSRFLDVLVSENFISTDTKQGQMVITIIEETGRTGVSEKSGQQQGQQSGQQQGQPNTIPEAISALSPDTGKDSDPDADRDSNGTVTRTKQKEREIKCKKVNKELVFEYAHEGNEFKEVFDDWLIHLKEIRKPITATALKGQIKFLKNFSAEQAIEIIENSTRNRYQGLFEPKNNSNGKQPAGNSTKAFSLY